MSLLQGTNVTVKVRLTHRSRAASRPALPGQVIHRPTHWLASLGTWLTALVLVYCSGGGSFSFFDPEANTQMGATSGAGGNSLAGRLIARLVLAGLFYVAWRASINVRRAVIAVPVLALLNCMGVISCLWSADPTFTLKQGIYLLVTYAFAVAFVAKPADRQMKLVQLGGVIAVVLCIGTVALFPQFGLNARQGVTGEWEGIYAGKNVCAMGLLFMLMPALYMKPATTQGRVLRVLYICSMLLVVALTRSRTGWALAVLLLVFAFGMRLLARFKPFDRAVVFILVSAATLFVGAVLLSNFDALLHMMGRNATFSGRTQIWSAILHSIYKQPWTGYGYRTFWRGMTGESANVMISLGWMMGYAHDGFLSVWVEVGFFGLALLGVCLFKGLRDAWFCLMQDPSPQVLWYITIVVFGILYNIDEATFLLRFQLLWILIIVAILGLDQRRRQIRRRSTALLVRG